MVCNVSLAYMCTFTVYTKARNKDLKVGGQVTTQNKIWPVTLVIWPVTNLDTKNIQMLMFGDC